MKCLSHLDLSHNKLSNLPNEFALLKNLIKLKINGMLSSIHNKFVLAFL